MKLELVWGIHILIPLIPETCSPNSQLEPGWEQLGLYALPSVFVTPFKSKAACLSSQLHCFCRRFFSVTTDTYWIVVSFANFSWSSILDWGWRRLGKCGRGAIFYGWWNWHKPFPLFKWPPKLGKTVDNPVNVRFWKIPFACKYLGWDCELATHSLPKSVFASVGSWTNLIL